jgi:hypothetical protein
LYRRFHRQALASQIDSDENVIKPALGIGDAVFAKDGVAGHGKVPRLPLAAALLQGRGHGALRIN